MAQSCQPVQTKTFAMREAELWRREKELMEREIKLLQMEKELLRNSPDSTTSSTATFEADIRLIGELISDFDGEGENFKNWSKQLQILSTTYELDDNATRLLLGAKLKGRALNWFYSRTEHLELPTDMLLYKMEAMFGNRETRLDMKRKIFVSESLRNFVVYHDSSSNDSEFASQIFKAKTDSVEAVTSSFATLDDRLDEFDLGDNVNDDEDEDSEINLSQHGSLQEDQSDDNDTTVEDNESEEVEDELKWKTNLAEKAKDAFNDRQRGNKNLTKLVYGVFEKRNLVEEMQDEKEKEKEEVAVEDQENEIGGIFRVVQEQQKRKIQERELQNQEECVFFSEEPRDWLKEENKLLVVNHFVTGKLKESDDAEELLKLDDLDDEDVYGDFEDLETGEKHEAKAPTEPTNDDIEEKKNLLEKKKKLKEPFRPVVSMPISIRRNSSLENMLCEDEAETWARSTSCEIVATHQKSSSFVMNEELKPAIEEESKVACHLPGSIKTYAELWKATKSKETPTKVDTSVSKPRSSKIFQPSNKQAGEAKCEVLNELLSNFSKIKLRPINDEKQGGCDGILHVKVDKETSDSTSEIYEAETVQYTHDNKYPTGFPQSSKQMRTSVEGKNSSDEFSFGSTPTTELSGFPASLDKMTDGHTEIVKVDVHRSEQGDDEDDLKASSSVLETYVESRFPRKNIVSNEKGDMSAAESSMLLQQVAGCSEKTDAEDCNDKELDERGPIGEQLDLSRRTGSGAKSAIARRIPQPHCNNNDNNRAVTPVAVSDDQSRDTVTITPGRVRSFVKYYEIRRDATTDNDSKTNDRDKLDRDQMLGHQSVVSIRRGMEARAIKTRPSEFRKDTVQTSVSVTSAVESASTKGSCAAITEMPEVEHSNRPNDSVEVIEDLGTRKGEDTSLTFPGESTSKSGKVKRKKSVQFQGGHTVIGAKCSQDVGPLGNPANQVTKSQSKSKALGRPTTVEDVSCATGDSKTAEQNDWVDAGAWSFNKREIAAQIKAAAGRGEFPGINSFVPNPETPRLVFYCTV